MTKNKNEIIEKILKKYDKDKIEASTRETPHCYGWCFTYGEVEENILPEAIQEAHAEFLEKIESLRKYNPKIEYARYDDEPVMEQVEKGKFVNYEELKNSIQSPIKQDGDLGALPNYSSSKDVKTLEQTDASETTAQTSSAPKEKKLVEVNYKTKNGKLVADEIYSDGSIRRVNVNNGVVDYILNGETSAPKSKQEVCHSTHDVRGKEDICDNNQKIRLICGKCGTEQFMKVKRYGKKPEDYTLYCPKCEDNISPSACKFKQKEEKK